MFIFTILMRFVLLNRVVFLSTIESIMEQHPVPQNVTTFQFRLVGDMTIKQFGYLASGIIGGYICYKLPLPFFFTWPLAITTGLLGFGLAFVPVEERPMDVWIVSFFKNVYSPTQWVWLKEKKVSLKIPPVAPPVAPQKTRTAPINTPVHAPPPPSSPHATLTIHHRTNPLDWISSLFRGKTKSATPSLSPGFSFADALSTNHPPSKPAPPVPIEKPQAATPPVALPATRPDAHEHVVELQGQLSQAIRERERLEKELIAMRQHAQTQTQTPIPMRQASVAPLAPTSTTSVRVISPNAATKAGLPHLTTFPNVVTGIVKDNYGNLLSGMLITVRDKDDTPLRALKTNKLGQFAASTPLPDNTYMIEIEDPKGGFIFDKAQILLSGAVAPPIEITAKSQKQVERDKLAREIFGDTKLG